MSDCSGQHRYFVAETGIDSQGKIVVILVCTSCGDGLKKEFEVAANNLQLQKKGK